MKTAFFLAFVLCLALCCPAKASETQTRYFTDNYPDYFDFFPVQSVGATYWDLAGDGLGLECRWGVRVYEFMYNRTDREITGGSPVAVVVRTDITEGYQSNTWTCPQTAFNVSSILHVEVWFYIENYGWTWSASWWTEPLLITSLASSTWNITYYTKVEWVFDGLWFTISYFYYGDSTRNSRVENIQVVPFEADGLSFSTGFILAMVIFLAVGLVVGAGIRRH